METSIRRWLFPFSLLSMAMGWFVVEHLINKSKQPVKFMKIRPIIPSLIYKYPGDILPHREDYFTIINLNRLDSIALLKFIAINACQIADTIPLKKYGLYRMEFYEHSRYMNDSSYHTRDRPLFHTATELDAFVSWIIYDHGEIYEILWYNTGEESSSQIIPITKEMKSLFDQCHKK